MSRFWPHTPFAEEQPYSHAILTTHVLTRAIQTGSVAGTAIGTSVFVLRKYNILKPRISPLPLTTTLLRSTGSGAIIGFGILTIALPLQLRGKEEIEWSDRSWRLLENKGQVECDDWTYSGMVIGAMAAASQRTSGWRAAVGKVGAGSVIGMLGYMAWGYGVKRGKQDEEKL